MKKLLLASLLTFFPLNAWAELPNDIQMVRTDSIGSDQTIMTLEQLKNLQDRLRRAVFIAYASQPRPFELAGSGITHDGACVAVNPGTILEILPQITADETDSPEDSTPVPEKKATKSHSFFDRDLHKSTSPFHKKSEDKPEIKTSRQYFMTTADWLTLSTSIEILIHGKKIPAKLEYRDDQQNLAVLSTPLDARIHPVDIIEPEQRIPNRVFVLLSPDSIYESMTSHTLTIPQMHLYGTATIPVRNGYPMFSQDARLAGLAVGPEQPGSSKTTNVVHTGLIDRAIHPAKYNIDVHEEIKVIEY